MVLASFSRTRAQVLINEVYYDHPGGDDGWEFVELYAAFDAPHPLAGARLELVDGRSGSARTVWTAPEDLVALPGSYILVAGSLRSPGAGFELRGALENGPDGIRLVSGDCVLDLVGYGELDDPILYEGTPAPDVEAGFSLARARDGIDTDRNGADFVAAAPTPGERNFYAIDLRISIGADEMLPCNGSPVSIPLTVANGGFERFRDDVRFECLIRSETGTVDGAETRRLVDLEPGASSSIVIVCAAPPSPSLVIEAALVAPGDQRPQNDSCRSVARTSPGQVIASEIMYRPERGAGEWIELENAGPLGCNIAGWMLSDAAGPRRSITDEDCWLEPGGYLIIAQDPESVGRALAGSAAVIGLAGSWPSLNDSGGELYADVVSLYDAAGMLVERVGYRDLLGEERGRSIERVSERLCSSAPEGIWHRCALACGSTPGAENSVHMDAVERSAGIRVEPNPFHADRHGAAAVSGSLASGEAGFRVRISSIDGIEVRRLFG